MAMTARAFLVLLLLCSAARAEVFVLGSSYSADARPWDLDDSPQWHIDCAKPLQYILDNPQWPCGGGSTSWLDALHAWWFDYVSFQPVAGVAITQQSDIDAIGHWMSLQPYAVGVIHATWPIQSIFEVTFHDSNLDHTLTNYSQAYYYDLIEKLEAANPGRAFVTDRANEMLDSIYHDIVIGVGPLTDFNQMFRDAAGHSSFDYGRYLQHNALRQAFGQPIGVGSNGIDPVVKEYLDSKVRLFEPASAPPPSEPPVLPPHIFFEHSGVRDPTGVEGWSGQEIAGQSGPVAEIDGTKAWFANDDSSTTASGASYSQALTVDQRNQAKLSGWKLSANIRVANIPDALGPLGASNTVQYSDGSVTWQMRFGSEADGDAIVDVFSDSTGDFVEFTLQGEGNGYHLYELVFDPLRHTADLFVDGVERLSNLTGRSQISGPAIYWGNRSGVDTGQGNYNLVRFELGGAVVPALPQWSIGLIAVAVTSIGVEWTRRRLSARS
jgi:hypothetical protein